MIPRALQHLQRVRDEKSDHETTRINESFIPERVLAKCMFLLIKIYLRGEKVGLILDFVMGFFFPTILVFL